MSVILDENYCFRWGKYTCKPDEGWGIPIHFGKSWAWYNPDCITITPENQLILDIRETPKEFINPENGEKVLSKYGIGLCHIQDELGFGTYEIKAKLPKGVGLWPAFWMYPRMTASPEIDWMEGYSETDNYRRTTCLGKLRPWKIQTCIHTPENWRGYEAMSPKLSDFNRDPSNEFIYYKMVWTRDILVFYLDGKEIRVFDDKRLMDLLANYKMRVIINTHIDGHFVDDVVFYEKYPLIVDYFNYIPTYG